MTMSDAVRSYLAGLRVTLWPGCAFDLTDPKELELAAQFLSEAMERVYDAAEADE